MKKIIAGLRYDTEKGIAIGTHHHGCYPGCGDFSHWSATLYRTPRSGRFFLAGKGGALTWFSQSCSDGMHCGGERIVAMTNDEALEWAEQYLDTDTIDIHFADSVEDA